MCLLCCTIYLFYSVLLAYWLSFCSSLYCSCFIIYVFFAVITIFQESRAILQNSSLVMCCFSISCFNLHKYAVGWMGSISSMAFLKFLCIFRNRKLNKWRNSSSLFIEIWKCRAWSSYLLKRIICMKNLLPNNFK